MRPIAVAALVLLAACGGSDAPTIDGSSQEAFTASLAAVRDGLDPATRARFDKAMAVAEAETFYAAPSRVSFEASLRARLDGKTAKDVIRTVRLTGNYNVQRSREAAIAATQPTSETR